MATEGQMEWAQEARTARQRMGWTQARLAHMLAVSRWTVVQWEAGRSEPATRRKEAYRIVWGRGII